MTVNKTILADDPPITLVARSTAKASRFGETSANACDEVGYLVGMRCVAGCQMMVRFGSIVVKLRSIPHIVQDGPSQNCSQMFHKRPHFFRSSKKKTIRHSMKSIFLKTDESQKMSKVSQNNEVHNQ